MKYNNQIECQIDGKYALFTDPATKGGGEKSTYCIPTYSSIKGMLESIYWKPTFIWVVDQIRIMNKIQRYSKGMKPIKYAKGGNDIASYSFLINVCYQIRAHFEWNEHRKDLMDDRNENKHYQCILRWLKRGGRYDTFLGLRNCQANVEHVDFGTGLGYYDNIDEIDMGIMFHSLDFINYHRYNCRPIMKKGIIDFREVKYELVD